MLKAIVRFAVLAWFAALAWGWSGPARAEGWQRAESPNFIIYAEAGAERARTLALPTALTPIAPRRDPR